MRILHSRRMASADMTTGSIARHIIAFAVPLLLGNLFQQLYNTVDAWVVGNYVSDTAFSAVGTLGPVVNILIGLFSGLSVGAGVVISQFFGAGQTDSVSKAVHTSMVLTVIMSALFTAIGLAIIPWTLHIINVPESVLPEASVYLTVYFSGIAGQLFYNIGAGILRAIGDSTRPFLGLVACAIVNTALDLLFVLVFNMGVEGVALATVISQAVSAVTVTVMLLRSKTCVRLELKKLKLDMRMAKRILVMGLPIALQNCILNISNVFVQAYINFFDKDVMGGWTAFSKLDAMLSLPAQSIANAATTFVGQNMGKGQIRRSKQCIVVSTVLCLAISVVIVIPLTVFAPECVAFFNSNPGVIQAGTTIVRTLIPLYLLMSANHVVLGAVRGARKTKEVMIISLVGYVLARQLYLVVVSRVCNRLIPIILSYPAGWIVVMVMWILLLLKMDWRKGCLTEPVD